MRSRSAPASRTARQRRARSAAATDRAAQPDPIPASTVVGGRRGRDAAAAVEPVAGVDPAVAVVDRREPAWQPVSLAIVKRKVELPPLCPSGWVTSHETAHSPFGSGFGTDTLSETPSSPTCGVPTAIGAPLHTTSTVLVAPSGCGERQQQRWRRRLDRAAGGRDRRDQRVVGRSTRGTANAPTTAMPTMTARPNTARRDGWRVRARRCSSCR